MSPPPTPIGLSQLPGSAAPGWVAGKCQGTIKRKKLVLKAEGIQIS